MPKPHAGKRKSLDFSIKQEVVKRKEEGQGNSAIGRALGLSESTVRTIWKKKDEIKASVKAYSSSQTDNCKHVWDEKLIKMERFLALWIERKEKEGSSVDKPLASLTLLSVFRAKIRGMKSNNQEEGTMI